MIVYWALVVGLCRCSFSNPTWLYRSESSEESWSIDNVFPGLYATNENGSSTLAIPPHAVEMTLAYRPTEGYQELYESLLSDDPPYFATYEGADFNLSSDEAYQVKWSQVLFPKSIPRQAPLESLQRVAPTPMSKIATPVVEVVAIPTPVDPADTISEPIVKLPDNKHMDNEQREQDTKHCFVQSNQAGSKPHEHLNQKKTVGVPITDLKPRGNTLLPPTANTVVAQPPHSPPQSIPRLAIHRSAGTSSQSMPERSASRAVWFKDGVGKKFSSQVARIDGKSHIFFSKYHIYGVALPKMGTACMECRHTAMGYRINHDRMVFLDGYKIDGERKWGRDADWAIHAFNKSGLQDPPKQFDFVSSLLEKAFSGAVSSPQAHNSVQRDNDSRLPSSVVPKAMGRPPVRYFTHVSPATFKGTKSEKPADRVSWFTDAKNLYSLSQTTKQNNIISPIVFAQWHYYGVLLPSRSRLPNISVANSAMGGIIDHSRIVFLDGHRDDTKWKQTFESRWEDGGRLMIFWALVFGLCKCSVSNPTWLYRSESYEENWSVESVFPGLYTTDGDGASTLTVPPHAVEMVSIYPRDEGLQELRKSLLTDDLPYFYAYEGAGFNLSSDEIYQVKWSHVPLSKSVPRQAPLESLQRVSPVPNPTMMTPTVEVPDIISPVGPVNAILAPSAKLPDTRHLEHEQPDQDPGHRSVQSNLVTNRPHEHPSQVRTFGVPIVGLKSRLTTLSLPLNPQLATKPVANRLTSTSNQPVLKRPVNRAVWFKSGANRKFSSYKVPRKKTPPALFSQRHMYGVAEPAMRATSMVSTMRAMGFRINHSRMVFFDGYKMGNEVEKGSKAEKNQLLASNWLVRSNWVIESVRILTREYGMIVFWALIVGLCKCSSSKPTWLHRIERSEENWSIDNVFPGLYTTNEDGLSELLVPPRALELSLAHRPAECHQEFHYSLLSDDPPYFCAYEGVDFNLSSDEVYQVKWSQMPRSKSASRQESLESSQAVAQTPMSTIVASAVEAPDVPPPADPVNTLPPPIGNVSDIKHLERDLNCRPGQPKQAISRPCERLNQTRRLSAPITGLDSKMTTLLSSTANTVVAQPPSFNAQSTTRPDIHRSVDAAHRSVPERSESRVVWFEEGVEQSFSSPNSSVDKSSRVFFPQYHIYGVALPNMRTALLGGKYAAMGYRISHKRMLFLDGYKRTKKAKQSQVDDANRPRRVFTEPSLCVVATISVSQNSLKKIKFISSRWEESSKRASPSAISSPQATHHGQSSPHSNVQRDNEPQSSSPVTSRTMAKPSTKHLPPTSPEIFNGTKVKESAGRANWFPRFLPLCYLSQTTTQNTMVPISFAQWYYYGTLTPLKARLPGLSIANTMSPRFVLSPSLRLNNNYLNELSFCQSTDRRSVISVCFELHVDSNIKPSAVAIYSMKDTCQIQVDSLSHTALIGRCKIAGILDSTGLGSSTGCLMILLWALVFGLCRCSFSNPTWLYRSESSEESWSVDNVFPGLYATHEDGSSTLVVPPHSVEMTFAYLPDENPQELCKSLLAYDPPCLAAYEGADFNLPPDEVYQVKWSQAPLSKSVLRRAPVETLYMGAKTPVSTIVTSVVEAPDVPPPADPVNTLLPPIGDVSGIELLEDKQLDQDPKSHSVQSKQAISSPREHSNQIRTFGMPIVGLNSRVATPLSPIVNTVVPQPPHSNPLMMTRPVVHRPTASSNHSMPEGTENRAVWFEDGVEKESSSADFSIDENPQISFSKYHMYGVALPNTSATFMMGKYVAMGYRINHDRMVFLDGYKRKRESNQGRVSDLNWSKYIVNEATLRAENNLSSQFKFVSDGPEESSKRTLPGACSPPQAVHHEQFVPNSNHQRDNEPRPPISVTSRTMEGPSAKDFILTSPGMFNVTTPGMLAERANWFARARNLYSSSQPTMQDNMLPVTFAQWHYYGVLAPPKNKRANLSIANSIMGGQSSHDRIVFLDGCQTESKWKQTFESRWEDGDINATSLGVEKVRDLCSFSNPTWLYRSESSEESWSVDNVFPGLYATHEDGSSTLAVPPHAVEMTFAYRPDENRQESCKSLLTDDSPYFTAYEGTDFNLPSDEVYQVKWSQAPLSKSASRQAPLESLKRVAPTPMSKIATPVVEVVAIPTPIAPADTISELIVKLPDNKHMDNEQREQDTKSHSVQSEQTISGSHEHLSQVGSFGAPITGPKSGGNTLLAPIASTVMAQPPHSNPESSTRPVIHQLADSSRQPTPERSESRVLWFGDGMKEAPSFNNFSIYKNSQISFSKYHMYGVALPNSRTTFMKGKYVAMGYRINHDRMVFLDGYKRKRETKQDRVGDLTWSNYIVNEATLRAGNVKQIYPLETDEEPSLCIVATISVSRNPSSIFNFVSNGPEESSKRTLPGACSPPQAVYHKQSSSHSNFQRGDEPRLPPPVASNMMVRPYARQPLPAFPATFNAAKSREPSGRAKWFARARQFYSLSQIATVKTVPPVGFAQWHYYGVLAPLKGRFARLSIADSSMGGHISHNRIVFSDGCQAGARWKKTFMNRWKNSDIDETTLGAEKEPSLCFAAVIAVSQQLSKWNELLPSY
ncbi:hypothetical protein PSACC_02259 [Paramicrosporidium saccamoebae]|uniref:Uncharacterized protein n=1 Tax=Paramicrosporidium saccamoebae TaxID=1246581 RepID=A0A2H9TJM6_9FUNG|nr:hypothetical protein PSACC_02259 [Paramicrosporidium saccamoebae]